MSGRIARPLAVLVFGLLAASPVGRTHAQELSEPLAPASDSAAGAAAAPVSFVVPANTVIELEMTDLVSSKTSKAGDFFNLRVAVAVMSGTTVLIPVGTPAIGQVVHAAKSATGGKPGELILAARYLELPQGQVKLRSSFGAAGKSRTGAALATTIAIGVLGLLVRGKQVELPVGSPLSARIAVDTAILASP